MQEFRRWYDQDPLLKEALELLQLQTDDDKTTAANFIIKLQEQVAQDVIESVYSIHIDLSSPELGSCKLTATFENQSPESILQVIASALHLKLGGDDTSFILSGMPCQSNK